MKVRIPSTPMKKSIKAARKQAQKAVSQGNAAVRKATRLAKQDPTTKNKNRVKRFKRTVARAKALDAKLAKSEQVANSMCPLQIMFSTFEYI